MTQISEKEHPELARSLNEMTTLLSRDHTERDWKWSVLRVLRALAVEIVAPPMMVVTSDPPGSMRDILNRLEKIENPCRIGCNCVKCSYKRETRAG